MAAERLRYIPYEDASDAQKAYIDADGGSAKVETSTLKGITNWKRVSTTDKKIEFEHVVIESISKEGIRTERDSVRMIVQDAVVTFGVRLNPHTNELEFITTDEIRPFSRNQEENKRTSVPQGHMLEAPELYETPEEAAIRELYEEAGIEGSSAVIIGKVDRDPSITDAEVHMVVVGCEFTEKSVETSQHQEHTESIKPKKWVSVKNALDEIMEDPTSNPWLLAGLPFLLKWHKEEIERNANP